MYSAGGVVEVAPRPDRRVRKSRRALGDALMGLLMEKSYEAVTVQDIIDRADLSRSTFYAHFIDKDSLLIDAFHDLRRRYATADPAMEQRGGRVFGWSLEVFDWSLALLRQFNQAGGIFRAVVGNEGCVLAQREMAHELDGLVRRDLAGLASIRDEQVPNVVVEFVVTAFMGILARWLENPEDLSPEEVDETFRVLTLPGAAAALGVSVELAPAPALVRRIAMARTGRPLGSDLPRRT